MTSFSTLLYTWVFGKFVGKDAFGNKYYRSGKREGKGVGKPNVERRWVIYKGIAEPSKIPPYWHGWLHYIVDEAPSLEQMEKSYDWEKDHIPNLTGTDNAYYPSGHISKGGKRDKATGDYNAWVPE